jgi:glucose-1-phosphate thymidylyltransferase
LLPVYDKPMVYYPISTLMLAGIREILLISTERDQPHFQALLGDGAFLGMRIEYVIQRQPRGLAEALILGEEFANEQPVALVLGDNIFYGNDVGMLLKHAAEVRQGGLIFGYRVRDPERYGVLELDSAGLPISIEEKPVNPKSGLAVPGLYFYGPDVFPIARGLSPSDRGELEITDVNRKLMHDGLLRVEILGRGVAWFDTGTPRSLLDAANFIGAVQERQGLRVAALEEIAWRNGWITDEDIERVVMTRKPGDYNEYLSSMIDDYRSERLLGRLR